MARRVTAGVAAIAVVCTLLACSYDSGSGYEQDTNNFREDVFTCEDALNRLRRCCADFDAKPILCNFFHSDSGGGCGASTTDDVEPAFSLTESRCIRGLSCDQLVANKVCERGQKARAYTRKTSTPSSTSNPSLSSDFSTPTPSVVSETHPPVCP